MDYVTGYCGECDEEYTVPENVNEPEQCPICGSELDTGFDDMTGSGNPEYDPRYRD